MQEHLCSLLAKHLPRVVNEQLVEVMRGREDMDGRTWIMAEELLLGKNQKERIAGGGRHGGWRLKGIVVGTGRRTSSRKRTLKQWYPSTGHIPPGSYDMPENRGKTISPNPHVLRFQRVRKVNRANLSRPPSSQQILFRFSLLFRDGGE